MAPWIISHFPAHRVYVEPFGGAASVLLQKPRSEQEVYNDIWDDVVNVFRVLRDPKQSIELERLLRLTPFARVEYIDSREDARKAIDDPIEKARRTIFRSFAGFGSSSLNANSKAGFRRNSKYKRYAIEWTTYWDCVPAFTERLRGVIIENLPAEQIIEDHDSPDTLFYIDPPYLHSERSMRGGNQLYPSDMNEDQHRRLAASLREIKGMAIVSGYPSALYDNELYPNWGRVQTTARENRGSQRTEVLWLHPNGKYPVMFSGG